MHSTVSQTCRPTLDVLYTPVHDLLEVTRGSCIDLNTPSDLEQTNSRRTEEVALALLL